MSRKKLVWVVVILMILSVFLLAGCNKKASCFTEEEHLQRVSERIKAKYIDGDETLRAYDKPINDGKVYPGVKATGFSVYPLYDQNDKLKFVLVEFEPFGFHYISIKNEKPKILSWFGLNTSMYRRSSLHGEPPWSPYRINSANEEIWETDENGEKIVYIHSPYLVRNIENEKRYFLYAKENAMLIPAVKREGKYINLISNCEFELENGQPPDGQATVWVPYFIGNEFDL